MSRLKIHQDPKVKEKMASYPAHVRPKMEALRSLVLTTAESIVGIDKIEETLKWGEPSYLTKKGSTIRMDWKEKAPEQYALYFNCNTALVATFRLLYGDQLTYEKNRALLFKLSEPLPEGLAQSCIAKALDYHRLKALPLLGG